MRITEARLTDFRNISGADLRLSDRLNALVGLNGQGKTNLVEALYSVAALRPLRSVTRAHLLRVGTDQARVSVTVDHERTGLTHTLAVELRSGSRTLSKDDKVCPASAFVGVLTAVAFTPDDLEISKGGPDRRRRFIDRAILNTRPAYLDSALRYQRALKSRNRLLVDQGDDELLDAYDHAVATEGAQIIVARAQYVRAFGPQVVEMFNRIAQPAPALTVRYRSSLNEAVDESSVANTAEAFEAQLASRRGRDRQRRTTSAGPHLDDVVFAFADGPVRARASQGQHRALVLAIKLAEIAHLTEALGESPVLLLDDISSELDADRSRQLFEALAERDAQVIMTTTDDAQIPSAMIDSLGSVTIYDVEAGRLTRRA